MISYWPNNLSFSAFQEHFPIRQDSIFREVFYTFRDQIKVQKEDAAIRNLETIFAATFKLANSHGFDAMSLRDLGRETGISMGGLYNYISSKDELAQMIEGFVEIKLRELGVGIVNQIGAVAPRLETMIRIYVYMGDMFQPWYRFLYMEAKTMARPEKERVKSIEIRDTDMIREMIMQGQTEGVFVDADPLLTSSAILALLQNWYLKHWQFVKIGTTTDAYADFVVTSVEKLLYA